MIETCLYIPTEDFCPRRYFDIGATQRSTTVVGDLAALRHGTLAGEPGAHGEYCNVNYDVAARLVEVVDGRDFADATRDRVFGRLGMGASAVGDRVVRPLGDVHMEGSHGGPTVGAFGCARQPIRCAQQARIAATTPAGWGFHDPKWLVEAQLVVSELVTNAVQHGGELIKLRIDAHDGLVTISAVDRSAGMPQRRTSDRHSGYGLAIIEELLMPGRQSHGIGKRVWVRLTPCAPEQTEGA